jgi:hypothetical protein
MEGIVTAAGHTLPSFAGYDGQGQRSPFGRPFAGSSEMAGLAKTALSRLANARDDARRECDDRSWAQRLFELGTDTTFTDSICARADQLTLAYDDLSARVGDPATTDEELGEIIRFVGQHADASDIIALAQATGWGHVVGTAVLDAPGTIVGAAGDVAGGIGAGIIGNIPWWAWAGGGVYLAVKLGWIDSKTFAKK